jgi:hypothetical protein
MIVSAPPSARIRRLLNDLRILVLSVTLAFGLWFGGGLLLAAQVAIPADDPRSPVIANDVCPSRPADLASGVD